METTMTTAELLSALALDKKENEEQQQQPYQSNMTAMQAVRAAAEQARQTPAYIQRLEAAMPHVLELCQFISDNQDIFNIPSDLGERSWGDIMGWIDNKCIGILEGPDEKAKRIVYLESMKYRFRDSITRSDAEAAINRCFEQGFLLPCQDGGLAIGKRKFQIPNKFGLTREDETVIFSKINKAFAVKESEKPKRPTVSPPKRNGNKKITASQAWKGEWGKFELHIPPNGTRKAGTLQMELQDGQILFVSQASNGLADLENGAIRLSALKDESGKPNFGHLKIVPPDYLTADKAREWQDKMERLGTILLCGFQATVEGQYDIDPKEFLTRDLVGDSILVYDGEFEWHPYNEDEGWVFEDLALRFHRRDDHQIALVEILPEEAENFPVLKNAIGKYHEPGERFSGVEPLFCRNFLKAVFKQVVLGRYNED